ncbi:MAG: hypothetical protein KDB90_00015 [Planctomycetes bacterium]|nr:hypothetical protein [Planctomycetota bacterium]
MPDLYPDVREALMTLRAVMLILVAALGGSLFAQGMSEDYVDARTEEKFSKNHGFSFEWDVYGYIPWFEQQQRVRSGGIGSDAVSYTKDMDGFPIGFFGGTELRFRFSWHDSIEAGYNLYYTRAFKDELDDFTRWNGLIYPPNTDIDYGSDFHDFHILYRRDLFRLGLSKNITFFVKAGLEYSYIRTNVGSDNFPAVDDKDVETFRELFPWYTAGFGAEIEIGQSFRITAEARATYEVGFPTFQRRDKNDMKQSIWSLTGLVNFNWNITDWFSLVVNVHYRYLRVRLYGGFRQDNFLWYSVGPDIGFGLRF